ncbi:hypothetical protein GUITHDRAFT_119270 [Guillardia theta CCMP2712]|uniref:Uncharacterized protein n=1 Tax=Guillardia theta (strain CCMP2712) TaxID=905079 RepID=L1IE28_GUITC|nr:hypothetical protein GUITHDRAFT_119270 [Guillardia theta CCMP2712]EKX34526.1 hypothetical protein GUITHDRAFT_119270 [Guillardia theta CCMP2712]|eukprot:XP_005821506.1 hypothetical protein GUITHDRAFT_119270 [Guillardia theta CCMP2712]
MPSLAILSIFLCLNAALAQNFLDQYGQCNSNVNLLPDGGKKDECQRLCNEMSSNSACAAKIIKLHNITSRVGLANTLQSNDFGTLAKDLFYKSLSSDAPQIDSCFANIQADWVARDFACTDDRNVNEVDLSFLRRVAVQVLPYRYYEVDSHSTAEVKPESFCISTMHQIRTDPALSIFPRSACFDNQRIHPLTSKVETCPDNCKTANQKILETLSGGGCCTSLYYQEMTKMTFSFLTDSELSARVPGRSQDCSGAPCVSYDDALISCKADKKYLMSSGELQ